MIAWKRNLVLAWLMATASSVAAFAASSPDRLKDSVVVGQGTASTKKITFDIGSGSANPAIQSTSAGVLQFAMDGVNFSTFGTGTGGGTGVSVLKNSGFEIGTANWTSAGSATFTTTASGANVGFDLAAGAWTPSATGATLTSDQYTVPSGMYGSVCSASVWYLGGSANVTLKVINGSSTVLASQVLSAQTAYVQTADLRFACPSSGTFALQLASTGSSATVYLDNAFLGQAPRRAPEDRNENLVVNGNAEDGLNPTNWTTYNDGASAALLTGTGGTASGLAAAAISSTSPIGGSRSWLMSKTGGSSAQGQGWSYQFTVNAKSQYQNALNDLAFDYYFDAGGAANADTVRVYLYDVTNSQVITPTFVTCGGGSTPSLAAVTTTCHAELGWLASATATTYRLGFHVAGTTASTFNLTVDNLFVGQHRLTVGTQVGPYSDTAVYNNWGVCTPAFSGTLRRVGDQVLIEGSLGISGGDCTSVGVAQFSFQNITLAAVNESLNVILRKKGASNDTATAAYLDVVGGQLQIRPADGSTAFGYLAGNQFGSTTTGKFVSIYINGALPVSQWAGGSAFGENKCEYASNSSLTDADDTASFVYGPNGNGGTLTALTSARKKRVRFTTPISATDQITAEVYVNNAWVPVTATVMNGTSAIVQPLINEGSATTTYGLGWAGVSGVATDIDAYFGEYRVVGSTYTGAGGGWNALSFGSDWGGWRMKKCKSGIPTAFGLANSSTPGLVSYEDSGTFTASFTGARSTTSTYRYARAGKLVTLGVGDNNAATCSAAGFVGAAQVPSALRPSQEMCWPVGVQDNNATATTQGQLCINASGDINLSKAYGTTNFTNAANCGWYRYSVTYPIN